MALATGTLWEIRATATTGNVNGAGFNTANAAFLTDLAATSATGNSPVVTSASYNFAAGDVGAWIYIKSGTNWTPGFYQIASVAANAATLSAAIGQAQQLNTVSNMYEPNTVAGVATTASPTAGTFGVDYSQQDTAQTTATDFAAVGASTTLTSATAAFTPVMVGNIFHQTTTGTGAFGITGWYEIATYVNATTVTLDRTPNTGTASVATTGFVGGAGRLNGLEDAFLEMVPAGSMIWIKNGTYVMSGTVNIASTNSTPTNTSYLMGYTSTRNDACNGNNRPLLNYAANTFTLGAYQSTRNIRFTGTSANGVTIGTGSSHGNCFYINTSSTTTRLAFNQNPVGAITFNCEAVSQNGTAFSVTASNARIIGCYAHDSTTGFAGGSGNSISILDCIVEACTTASISGTVTTAAGFLIYNCTLYGREAKLGTGINLTGANSPTNFLFNNILYGFTTGISINTGFATSNVGVTNDYFNNTSDVSNWYKNNALALDPQFVGASQITGTTATTSGSVLTQSGGDFSTVTDNVDYLHVISGTGVTVGNYLITSHTSTTLTVNNALGTSSGGDVVYFVTVGHNFQIGTNLAGVGFPSFLNVNSETTSYPAVGAVQRQFGSLGSSTVAYTFVS